MAQLTAAFCLLQHYATPGGAWIKGKMGHLPFSCQPANATLQPDRSLAGSADAPIDQVGNSVRYLMVDSTHPMRRLRQDSRRWAGSTVVILSFFDIKIVDDQQWRR